MNLLSSILPSEFKRHIIVLLQQIAAKHPGTRLNLAINDLIVFVNNYASCTPAKLAFIYAFSSIEKEAVQLMTNVYLAILETRGFNTNNISSTQLEYLNSVVLKMLRSAPAAGNDYYLFCKRNGHIYTDETTQLRLNNKLMAAYFENLAKNIDQYKDPLIRQILQVLEAHKLIYRKESGYDFEQLRYMFLFLLLKLHATVNITAFLNNLLDENVKIGQFEQALTIIVRETWPQALDDTISAKEPIYNLARELMANGDPSIMRYVTSVFMKLEIPIGIELANSEAQQNQQPQNDAEILRFTRNSPRKIASGELLRMAFRA